MLRYLNTKMIYNNYTLSNAKCCHHLWLTLNICLIFSGLSTLPFQRAVLSLYFALWHKPFSLFLFCCSPHLSSTRARFGMVLRPCIAHPLRLTFKFSCTVDADRVPDSIKTICVETRFIKEHDAARWPINLQENLISRPIRPPTPFRLSCHIELRKLRKILYYLKLNRSAVD